MHHGTCVTHVSWCMSGSLTHDGWENVPGIPGACAARNFTYLARGPRILWRHNQELGSCWATTSNFVVWRSLFCYLIQTGVSKCCSRVHGCHNKTCFSLAFWATMLIAICFRVQCCFLCALLSCGVLRHERRSMKEPNALKTHLFSVDIIVRICYAITQPCAIFNGGLAKHKDDYSRPRKKYGCKIVSIPQSESDLKGPFY